jgi:hypothetical protein
MRSILDTMHAIAALRCDVHFTVRHDGRVALDLPRPTDCAPDSLHSGDIGKSNDYCRSTMSPVPFT